jgi:putative membrane protein
MTRIMSAAVVLGLLGASTAFAQTGPATQPGVATTTPSATATTPPVSLKTPPASTAAPTQSATAPSVSTAPPAVSTSNADSKTAAAPVSGANSFTEAEARTRLQAHGYSNVTGLTKDDQSIWRGKAMKDGKSVDIALDYQGNIVAH